MPKIKNAKKSKMQKLLIVLSSILVVGLIGFGLYIRNSKQQAKEDKKVDTDSISYIDYSGPTDIEKQAVDDNKKALQDRLSIEEGTAPVSNGSMKSVSPVISFFGQNQHTGAVEVGSFIPEIYEDDGTCTLVLKNGAQEVSATQTSSKDARTTTCGVISIERSKLSAHNWEAQIKYNSPNAKGVSATVTIPVK